MEERYTDIRLVKVPIEIDNKNQLTFASKTVQYNYFNSCEHIEVDDSSYQRKDSTIRYPGHIDDLIGYNYCMYKNTTYSNKWFYAFITDMKYISDSMTLVSIKTDVWQTWQFDIEIKRCFVEREHVNSDNYAEHTVPENLETGEYINLYSTDSTDLGSSHLVMATTISPIDGETAVSGQNYGGIYSGVKYYVFQNDSYLSNALALIAGNGHSDSVVSIFYCPDWITEYSTGTWSDGIKEVPNRNSVSKGSGLSIPLHPTAIDGYVPKNKKLFTYPYVAYLLSNNAGSSMTYRLEDFLQQANGQGDYTGDLEILGTCTPGCSIRIIPKNYKVKDTTFNEEYNNEYGLNAPKFPIASWGNDSYTNWLTQTGINVAGVKIDGATVAVGKGVVNTAVGAGTMLATGGAMGGFETGAGIGQIFNAIQEVYHHSFNPVQATGNINSGDVTYSAGKLTFTGYFMTIKAEYARIIDEYFSAYGYRVNRIKVPNITGRSNWNYVKTINCNIHGYIPQEDCLEIKNMFNAGVTFWHNPSHFLDYSQSNNIV